MHQIYLFQLYHRPGLSLGEDELATLKKELHTLGSTCLKPLPNYQVFSSSPDAFNDKIIVTAYTKNGSQKRLVGFTSAVLLEINIEHVKHPVLHGGLTLVAPSDRQSGLPVQMFRRLFGEVVERYDDRVWVTSVSEMPRMLVHFCNFVQSVYPSPYLTEPTQQHLEIARAISESQRPKMFIAPSAVFEEASFTFRGSNATNEAQCFRKSGDDPSFLHMDRRTNDFYLDLLRVGQGDEVLQVGYIDRDYVQKMGKLHRFDEF